MARTPLSGRGQLAAVLLAMAWRTRCRAGSMAQDQLPAAVAVVVDYARILRDAKAAKAIRDQIDARRKVYQDQIAKEEKRLFDADKELAKQRSVLSPEAFAEKRKAFEQDVAEVQRMAQERRRQLDQVAAVALGEVRNSLVEVVGALQDQRGFNLVLPSSAVLLFSPQIDLTEEVLAQLDKKLPDRQGAGQRAGAAQEEVAWQTPASSSDAGRCRWSSSALLAGPSRSAGRMTACSSTWRRWRRRARQGRRSSTIHAIAPAREIDRAGACVVDAPTGPSLLPASTARAGLRQARAGFADDRQAPSIRKKSPRRVSRR